jgi:CysZ protein
VGFTIGLLALLIIVLEGLFSHFRRMAALDRDHHRMVGRPRARGWLNLPHSAGDLADGGLYLDDIAGQVRPSTSRRPAGRKIPALALIGAALKFFLVVLVVNLAALFLLLVPGSTSSPSAAAICWGANISRWWPCSISLRRRGACKANLTTVFLAGLIIAGLASVPIANLLTPLFATAFMVHVYKSLARRAGLSRLSPRPA